MRSVCRVKIFVFLMVCCFVPLSYGVEEKSEKFQWHEAAAKEGYAGSQYNLGVMYYLGEGVQKDYKKALEWFKVAANQGHDEAKFRIGQMYANGEVVERSPLKAFYWKLRGWCY